MFDVGFSELVVIGIVALIVLGPKRLPEVARAAGRWAGRLRRFVEDVKRDMSSELHGNELAELRKVQQEITETRQALEQSAGAALASIPAITSPEQAHEYLVKSAPEAPETPQVAAAATPRKKAARVKPSGSAARPKKKTPTTSRPKHGRATRKPR